MDRYLKYLCDELEIKENYVDNEGRYIQYIEVSELNKIINNVVSIKKIEELLSNLENALEVLEEYENKNDNRYINSRLQLKSQINILKNLINGDESND